MFTIRLQNKLYHSFSATALRRWNCTCRNHIKKECWNLHYEAKMKKNILEYSCPKFKRSHWKSCIQTEYISKLGRWGNRKKKGKKNFGTSKHQSYLLHPSVANDEPKTCTLTISTMSLFCQSKPHLKVLHRIITNKKQTSSYFSIS